MRLTCVLACVVVHRHNRAPSLGPECSFDDHHHEPVIHSSASIVGETAESAKRDSSHSDDLFNPLHPTPASFIYFIIIFLEVNGRRDYLLCHSLIFKIVPTLQWERQTIGRKKNLRTHTSGTLVKEKDA